MKIRKVLLTIFDLIIVVLASYWCFGLMFYFSATVDGSIYISSDYAIWERNYLVPAQIFGIPIIVTIVSIILYRKLRMKNLIGKKYIALVLYNIIPLYIIGFFQIINWIDYWNVVY
ncbi:MAG: hypothetical protein ACI4I9_07705 [Porcipelethomonas sp.]